MSAQLPTQSLAEPVDLSHHFSRGAKSRAPSSMKSFYKYFSIPGIAQLAGGLPNADYFPYDTLEAKVALPERWGPSDKAKSSSRRELHADSHLLIPHSLPKDTDISRKIDLTSVLQYGTAQGYPALYSFLKQFSTEFLNPTIPYEGGADIILTCGNTDGWSKVLATFTNDWFADRDPIEEREGILVEEFAYMGAVGSIHPHGLNVVPVAMDSRGMLAYGPGGLRDVLENWDFSKGKRPHLIYTVTIGQNPTGVILDIERRKELYAICRTFDVIICEDDPYWYLQFPSARGDGPEVPPPPKSSGFPFLDSMMPSSLSIDIDGRVIRLDTFSKTVAPGCRLGFITAQPRIIERITRVTETTTQQPSGFVQGMIAELLIGPNQKPKTSTEAKGWDMSGWVRWLEGLRSEYESRMNDMCDAFEEHSTVVLQAPEQHEHWESKYEWNMTREARGSALDDAKGIPRYGGTISIRRKPNASDSHTCPTCSSPVPASNETDAWSVVTKTPILRFHRPRGGMFVWVEILYAAHPLFNRIPNQRLAMALWMFLAIGPAKVLATPGVTFAPSDKIRDEEGWKFFRLSFAAIARDELVDASTRFGKGVQQFWEIKDVSVIDDILKDIESEGVMDMMSALGTEGLGRLTGFC